MITRRTFLGILGVSAAVPVAIMASHSGEHHFGTSPELPEGLHECVVETDPLDDHGRGMSIDHATRLLHRRILKHLGPLYRITGSSGPYYIGDGAAGARFDLMISSFVPEVDGIGADRLQIDRVFLDNLSRQFAERVQDAGIIHTGELETPTGYFRSATVVNKRLALRGVSYYDIVLSRYKVRWDILGATA